MDPSGFMQLLQMLGQRAKGAAGGLDAGIHRMADMPAAMGEDLRGTVGGLAGAAGGMAGGLPPGMGPGGSLSFPGSAQLGGMAGAAQAHPAMAAGIGGGGLLAALLAAHGLGGDDNDGDELQKAGPGTPPTRNGLVSGRSKPTDRVPQARPRRPANDRGPNNGM